MWVGIVSLSFRTKSDEKCAEYNNISATRREMKKKKNDHQSQFRYHSNKQSRISSARAHCVQQTGPLTGRMEKKTNWKS